jgi:xylan 1,4-beta-xylosidase
MAVLTLVVFEDEMKDLRILGLIFLFLSAAVARAQQDKTPIQIHADQTQGPSAQVWNYFGYDEPNYTYAPNGKKLLRELAAITPRPVYIRTHNLFTTGDGTASLKWGSTNVYTEDAAGKPVYSWTIIDRIFDAFHEAGVKPLVEIGFMPESLSVHPQPYRHNFPQGTIFTGWAYPPKDYTKWSELVFQFARHLRERYGESEVKTWLWEVWNEPDIGYWQGTPDEYFKLYDFSVDAVLRALPDAHVGGPDTTGAAAPKAAEFLRQFLDHCAHQKNYVTGKVGSRLNFISFHPKGSPKWQGDHVEMGIARQLASIDQGFKIVASFPEWRSTPIILGESDPEGCAACSAEKNPQNAYRNGPLYASYTAEVLNLALELAKRQQVNLQGSVTWAFEFEDQPYFAGFRELASNGLDKPVLNAFRALGLLRGERISATSSGALLPEDVLRGGVRERPEINAIASRTDREIDVMIWNYHDEDLPVADAAIEVTINGLPPNVSSALLDHFRVDRDHGNAFAAWKKVGAPQTPSADQYRELEHAGQLELLHSPEWLPITRGNVQLQFSLPRQGISLLRLSW